jgi:hypothetical protein
VPNADGDDLEDLTLVATNWNAKAAVQISGLDFLELAGSLSVSRIERHEQCKALTLQALTATHLTRQMQQLLHLMQQINLQLRKPWLG